MTEPSRGRVAPVSTQAEPRGDQPARIAELDAVRGVGALAILGYHLRPVEFFLGWTRVDLFFILSGYLITGITLKHRATPGFLVAFWARRVLRIWPAYFLLLGIVTALMQVRGEPARPGRLLPYLTFTQNVAYYWGEAAVPPPLPGAQQTWSLAIEEQFYLVWPLVVLVAGRSFLTPVALGLVVNSVAARVLGLDPVVALSRCDGLMLGSLLAVALGGDDPAVRRPAWTTPALAAVGLAAACALRGPMAGLETPIANMPGCGPLSILAVNVFYACALGVIICHTGHPLLAPLRNRALAYLGRISYGVFLYHMLIIEAVSGYLGSRNVTSDAVAVVLSLTAAAVSWECVESPINRLKTLFPYGVSRGGRGTAARDGGPDRATPAPRPGTVSGAGRRS